MSTLAVEVDAFGNNTSEVPVLGKVAQEYQNRLSEARDAAWEEKYRPKKLEDLLLPKTLKEGISNSIKMGIQNMIFYSPTPGSGKTSTAKVICEELGCQYKIINASSDGRLATVKDDIAAYALQGGSNGRHKVVILDEVDGVTSDSFFDSLRGVIEWSTETLRFILTCNHIHKVDAAILSRCKPISFEKTSDVEEEKAHKNEIYKRLRYICDTECGDPKKVSKETITNLIKSGYPDIRSMIKALQWNYITNDGLITGSATIGFNGNVETIWNLLKGGDWSNARKVYNENGFDHFSFYRTILEYGLTKCPDQYKMAIASVVAEFQYRSSFQVDQEINMTCGLFPALISIMSK